jgi:hypothetical protein
MPVQCLLAGMERDPAVSDILTMDQILGRNSLEASFEVTLLVAVAVPGYSRSMKVLPRAIATFAGTAGMPQLGCQTRPD